MEIMKNIVDYLTSIIARFATGYEPGKTYSIFEVGRVLEYIKFKDTIEPFVAIIMWCILAFLLLNIIENIFKFVKFVFKRV